MSTNYPPKERVCKLSDDGRRYPTRRAVAKARQALGGAESSQALTDWYVAQYVRANHLTSEKKK